MSIGHPHKNPSRLSHTGEVNKLLKVGGAPSLMKRWQHLDLDHDIVYCAGYNVAGTIRYADRDFVHALFEPAYAEQIIGKAIDTGLSPEDTLEAVLWHEAVEKVLLDSANPIDSYEAAHEMATAAEHDRVRELGGTPVKYERGLAPIIAFCLKKKPEKVPQDYCCAPYLDDPDAADRKAIKEFRRLGVVDAFKIAKSAVDYGMTRGAERCGGCAHFQHHGGALSPCDVVEGLVRDTRGCDKFEAMEGSDGELHQGRDQAPGPRAQAGG